MTEVKRLRAGNGNCYIVSSGDSAVLIDAGKKRYYEKILNMCKPYKIRLILLTHGHFDHIQNAAALSRELNAPVAMHGADIGLIKDNFSQSLSAKGFLGRIVLSASEKSFRSEDIPPFVPDILLSDGDSLKEYGIDGAVLSVPGHTDGSVAVDVEQKYLFVGDALMNMFYPAVSMIYHNEDQMLKSAGLISSLGGERIIYFGHGKPVRNRKWAVP